MTDHSVDLIFFYVKRFQHFVNIAPRLELLPVPRSTCSLHPTRRPDDHKIAPDVGISRLAEGTLSRCRPFCRVGPRGAFFFLPHEGFPRRQAGICANERLFPAVVRSRPRRRLRLAAGRRRKPTADRTQEQPPPPDGIRDAFDKKRKDLTPRTEKRIPLASRRHFWYYVFSYRVTIQLSTSPADSHVGPDVTPTSTTGNTHASCLSSCCRHAERPAFHRCRTGP